MFADPQTGAKGMVSTVEDLSTYVQALRNTLRVLNWLLGLIGLGGLTAIVRWFGGAQVRLSPATRPPIDPVRAAA